MAHDHGQQDLDLSARAASLNADMHFRDALETIDQACEQDGRTPELDLLRIEGLIGLEQYRDAYNIVGTLLEEGGEAVRGRSLMYKARILRRSSRYLDSALEAALDAATIARRQGDGEVAVEAHLEAARAFAMKHCRALAERELENAKEVDADLPLLGTYTAAILMDFDDRLAAREVLEGMVGRGGKHTVLARQSLAYLEYVLGEFEAAHGQLEALAPMPGGALWPRRTRVALFDVQQRWLDAATQLAELRQLSPENDSLWRDAYNRANYLYRGGDLAEARHAFAEVVEHSPEDDYFHGLAERMTRLLGHPEAGARPRKRLREFPSVSQLKDHCGPASCELYLRFFGLSDSQLDIARQIKSPDGGTPVYKMRRYLEAAGFATRRVEAEIDVIKRLLDAGIPVIMEESYSSSNHVAVAIGYDDAREILEVQDPMTHTIRETFYEDLAGIRNLSNHGALIAAPKSDPALVRALDQVGGGECRYISLIDEAWAALDEERTAEGDRLADESIGMRRDYEMAWMYRFNRARDAMNNAPGPENRVALHRVLAEITSLWPDDEWPQQLLGQALYFDNRAGEALVAFERARDRDPNDAYNWSMIADCHLESGDNDAAYDALVEALARDPSFPRANENLADLAMKRGNMTLAWQLNDAARELRPQNPFNAAVHGQLLDKKGMLEEALEAYDNALSIDAERDWIAVLRAKLLGKLDRVDEAVAAFDDLIARRPDAVGHQIDLADLLYEKHRPDRAIEVSRRILEAIPGQPSGHAILGASLMQKGEIDAGIAELNQALAARPGYVWVYKEMGKYLLEAGRAVDAVSAFAAAVGMSRGNPWREFDLGDALVRSGHAGPGVDFLRTAALHGNLDEAQLRRIGRVMADENGGNYVDAFFKDLYKHQPDDPSVLRAHASTMVDYLWAPNAAESVLSDLAAVAPNDPYAQAWRGCSMMAESMDDEDEGEELLRAAIEAEPDMQYGRRQLADALVDRGRFAEAIEVLAPCSRHYTSDRLRVVAHLGLAQYDQAQAIIDAFRAEYGQEGQVCVGAVMLDYLVAQRRWDWKKALELAEVVSRESHERDDDGRLDRWEQERFECMAHLGEVERALRFGEAQAVDADSLGRLAYSAYGADRMGLAAELAHRALHLDPDDAHGLAVMARISELHGDLDKCKATWQRLGEVSEDWHVWQEQLARLAVAEGDIDTAAELAEDAVANGHLCAWAFGVRAQANLLAGDTDQAAEDCERSWNLCAPQNREHEGFDVWGIRAALGGDRAAAEQLFARYLAGETPVSEADKGRIARIRAALD
ncbi:MAG TPA: tetratricopeptide repeat protein [Kofleriaceae bacterium]|nr:tetratricopeptide repeat protein [Kofleriaceae bacterium]